MIKRRILVTEMSEATLDPDHELQIKEFIENPDVRLLVAFNDVLRGFTIMHTIPPYPVSHLCYFIKPANLEELTNQNFLKDVQYGAIKGGHIESLLRIMMGIYAPIFFENRSWPDSILYRLMVINSKF